MKTANPSLPLLVIFLLSALAANTLVLDASAGDAAPFLNPAVFDIDGDVVMADQPYYIVSAIWGGGGGGLRVGCTRKTGTTCPLDILQMLRDVDNGVPFSFSPVNKAAARFMVQESTDLNIISPGVKFCGIKNSTMWGLEYDNSKSKYFVKTCAPAEGNPVCANWFKFIRVSSTIEIYKIVFCPTVCDNPVCKDIGIYYDANGKRRLALSDRPFLVIFIKASGSVPTITTVSAHYDK